MNSSSCDRNVFDHDNFSRELSELEQLFKTKTLEHRERLREAERAGWTKAAVEVADTVLVQIREIHQRISDLGRSAEDHLAAKGVLLPEEPNYPIDQLARYWKDDLQHKDLPITASIEDLLDSGLEYVISRLPSAWWKEQVALRVAAGSAHLRESLELYGGISGKELAAPIHRYAHGLMLARESLVDCLKSNST